MRFFSIYKKKQNNILLALVILLYVSFFLPMGSSIPTLLLLSYYIISHKYKIGFKVSAYIIYIVMFVAFCYSTTIWASRASNVLVYSNHLLKTLFGIFVLYLCVIRLKSVDLLLKAMLYGGYLVLFYVIAFYGINGILMILRESTRMTNEVMNANVFAMCISYSCVIHIYYGVKDKKWSLLHLLIFPAIALLAISGSRKGLIVLVGGIIGIIVWDNFRKNKSFVSLIKILLIISLIFLGVSFVLQLPAFSFLNERVNNYFSFLRGSEDVDNSLITRSKFIERGIDIFKSHPILGVGIDNARLFNYRDVYLHNNFVEMLADGGVIGFFLYYWFYIYLFVKLVKTKNKNFDNYGICLLLLILSTIVHYAHVAYRASNEYYMLLTVYLELLICSNIKGNEDEYIKSFEQKEQKNDEN